jgi:hypothetical protein
VSLTTAALVAACCIAIIFATKVSVKLAKLTLLGLALWLVLQELLEVL